VPRHVERDVQQLRRHPGLRRVRSSARTSVSVSGTGRACSRHGRNSDGESSGEHGSLSPPEAALAR
jgi:hypothetical protein